MVCFVVTQHSESALSLCLRYSKTSCEATKKIPFSETVNYNAWCELALSKKQEQSSRNLFFLSENCNTASHKNWKSWCQWPVPVTSRMMPPCCWISTTRNSVARNSLPRFSWKRKRLLWAGATIVAAGLVVGSGGCHLPCRCRAFLYGCQCKRRKIHNNLY